MHNCNTTLAEAVGCRSPPFHVLIHSGAIDAHRKVLSRTLWWHASYGMLPHTSLRLNAEALQSCHFFTIEKQFLSTWAEFGIGMSLQTFRG